MWQSQLIKQTQAACNCDANAIVQISGIYRAFSPISLKRTATYVEHE